MNKQVIRSLAMLTAFFAGAMFAHATNGDNLIGVGPSSRGMGGTGVAAPQDSITAIFDNPAAMNACPCGAKSEAVFGATIFDPTVNAKITTPMGTYEGTSQHDFFVIPAFGVTMPINEDWRFGIGAYGISGLGVDYRNMGWDLDGDPSNGFEGDLYSRLEVMKFAPMVAYDVNEKLTVGVAMQAGYNNLDMGEGGSHDYSIGAQIGALYNMGTIAIGATYTSPQKATFDNVFNFDAHTGDVMLDDLSLEAPETIALGIAYTPDPKFVVAADVKQYAWSKADGYSDFDWDDQLVIAVGAQYQATDNMKLRVGYNYAENPVNEHNDFSLSSETTIQGTSTPTLGYEMFRTIGFPAIVDTHVTFGIGYQLSETVTLSLEYMHAFEKTITETSEGQVFELESSLEEDSYSFALGWQFE